MPARQALLTRLSLAQARTPSPSRCSAARAMAPYTSHGTGSLADSAVSRRARRLVVIRCLGS